MRKVKNISIFINQSIYFYIFKRKERAIDIFLNAHSFRYLALNALFHLVEDIVVFAVGIALFVNAVFQRTFDNFIFIFFAFDDTDHDCKADNGYTKGFEHG